jgi:hypothetical protein
MLSLMAKNTQDDEREIEMRTIFNLSRPKKYGRGGIDAVLELDGASVPEELRGQTVPFELKSSTGGSPDISTVRDFGPHYMLKWETLHWIFGVYEDGELQYCLYGSPDKMADWYEQKAAYVRPDFALLESVPDLIGDEILSKVLGDAEDFGLDDAKALMKRQKTIPPYREAADLEGGRYSRTMMLKLLQERCRYVLRRGATLNNPHISPSFFGGWEKIERNHAARLRELVVDAFR